MRALLIRHGEFVSFADVRSPPPRSLVVREEVHGPVSYLQMRNGDPIEVSSFEERLVKFELITEVAHPARGGAFLAVYYEAVTP